jgi:hypothetical protein
VARQNNYLFDVNPKSEIFDEICGPFSFTAVDQDGFKKME